ncbi:hypothetical protein WN944_022120 [Citrus x changshan-huyou]|uniref:Uncharacterized protein n=1 Tax=Citrus x changshan-huyou TaxID=2935761 RepID=A0AAP0N0C1_9ROSI
MTVVTFQAVLPLQARGLCSSILSNPILKAVSSHGAIGLKSTLIIMGVIPFLVLADENSFQLPKFSWLAFIIAVFLNAIPGKIHPKLCEKHYKPCNIASFWKANAMTVGTQWASDLQAQNLSTSVPRNLGMLLTNSHSCESLQVVAACSSGDHSWLPELHSMDWHLMVLYLENDPEITIPLEELDMLSIVFGYKASYCYMTATENIYLYERREFISVLAFSLPFGLMRIFWILAVRFCGGVEVYTWWDPTGNLVLIFDCGDSMPFFEDLISTPQCSRSKKGLQVAEHLGIARAAVVPFGPRSMKLGTFTSYSKASSSWRLQQYHVFKLSSLKHFLLKAGKSCCCDNCSVMNLSGIREDKIEF